MSQPTLGFAFTLEQAPRDVRAVADEWLSLVTSDVWAKPLRYFSTISMPGKKSFRRPGMIARKALPEVLASALSAEETATVDLATSARTDEMYAHCWVDTQHQPWTHLRPRSAGRRPWDPSTSQGWVDALLGFADRAHASHGVVYAMPTSSEALCEEDFTGIILHDGSLAHPFPEQFARMSRHQKVIGVRYVRFPRWGTLYSQAQVAELGGIARIAELVQPAVVRELRAGVYFQLTDSADTAISDEAMAKQRRFETLAEPLLPPKD